jgi:hypothetical protein
MTWGLNSFHCFSAFSNHTFVCRSIALELNEPILISIKNLLAFKAPSNGSPDFLASLLDT